MNKNYEIAIYAMVIVGALLGFMYFNYHPARIFMGDTGSLALGGVLAALAVLTHQELLFILIGGVFLIEHCLLLFKLFLLKQEEKECLKWLLFIIILKCLDGVNNKWLFHLVFRIYLWNY